jgi:hypothetical protein
LWTSIPQPFSTICSNSIKSLFLIAPRLISLKDLKARSFFHPFLWQIQLNQSCCHVGFIISYYETFINTCSDFAYLRYIQCLKF